MTRPPVVYIAGPFRAPTAWGIVQNIHGAAALAVDVWKLGAVALCPHLNSAPFTGVVPDERFLEGDLELLRRADAVIFTDNFRQSVGAVEEWRFAVRHDIPVFQSLGTLAVWLADRRGAEVHA